jgi:hypothetical protein
MNMIAIYQIPLNGVFSDPAVLAAKSDLMLGFNRWKDDYSKMYVRTYEVDTDDLEKAFESTNLWEDYSVVKLRKGSSTSVGDIAVKDGNCYFCDTFGWVALGKYEGMN